MRTLEGIVDYVDRLVDLMLDDMMAGLPAVLVVGPRACGKSTTARRHVRDVVELDLPADADLAGSDPDAVLRIRDKPSMARWPMVVETLHGSGATWRRGPPTSPASWSTAPSTRRSRGRRRSAMTAC